jgi:hypothetical protein
VILKRRNPKPLLRAIAEFFWPRGGWMRAATYVLHRMRRLPDTPERICVGIAAGSFVSFLPLYGLHFLSAALVAWIVRGNILAALLGTFYGNPITFPIMAVTALELGHWLLGSHDMVSFSEAMAAIGHASGELTHNLFSVITGEHAHWNRLADFFWRVFLPYMIGGVILGLPAAVAIYVTHLPLVRAYQRGRQKRLRQRFEAARARQRAAESQPGEPGETS